MRLEKSWVTVVALVFTCVTLVLAASAHATVFHIARPGNMSRAKVYRTEGAIAYQVNTQVVRHWHVDPINFSNYGLPIYFVAPNRIESYCGKDAAAACHGLHAIWIVNGSWRAETEELDHEIIETLTDPTLSDSIDGLVTEACDPVDDLAYRQPLTGVWLTDFVFRRWFRVGSSGPWDYLHRLTHARSVRWGYTPD